MGTNARLSVTYYDNIRKEEHTKYYEIGLHPIHEAAKKDVGGPMAYSAVKDECGHENFKILNYSVIKLE